MRVFVSIFALLTLAIWICVLESRAGGASPAPTDANSATAVQQPRTTTAAPNTRSKDNVQAYVAAMRADLARGKVQTISAVMKLTTDEGRVFWPIYHDYETEQLELGAQRGAWLEKYRDAAELQRINDGQAKELAESYFKFEQQRLDLLKKYHEIRSREVSPVCAAQFTQAEHRIATLSDLLIASETPMIDTGLADATK